MDIKDLQDMPEGRILLNILAAKKTLTAVEVTYEIVSGPYTGVSSAFLHTTGKTPIKQRIDLKRGQKPLQCLCRAAGCKDLDDLCENGPGRQIWANVCAQFVNERTYFHVSQTYPFSRYSLKSEDILTGTDGWGAGKPDVDRAIILAKYSGFPVLFADVHERNSPMVTWCADHGIIILPFLFVAGDYSVKDSSCIVDRKANIEELHDNFIITERFHRYCRSAQLADLLGKRLVYVTATKPEDQVSTLKDLKHFSRPGSHDGQPKLDGEWLYNQIVRYQTWYPHTDFMFVPEDKLCETIYQVVCDGVNS